VRNQFKELQAAGYGHLPVCMAKTLVLVLDDPTCAAPQRPRGADPGAAARAGAEFIRVVTGDIMTMPGLPKVPSANVIKLNELGQIEGCSENSQAQS